MGRIPDQFIDGLLARVDIVELIGSRLPMKRAGREYTARCPFHDERSPSFYVSPTKQFYHCFGCGAHGTAIKFLMEYDRLEFTDAVEELAKRVGLEVPRDEGRGAAPRGDTDDLYAALDAAQRFFVRELGQSSKAQAYLQKRGLDTSTIEKFGIGYAPEGWDGLKSALGRDDARRTELLDKTGLLSRSDNGKVYDKFRRRVMFPIHDRRGRVIAFGGRVLEKDDGPKYLNSPETALFHKGRELYGLFQVRQAHSKIPRLIVVEGYMDVVSLWQFGITTAVATLGTATTPEHAELLFRNSGDVYFCFDGDEAGRRAAWRGLESVLPRMTDGRQAFFLFLPEGEDPDTLVRAKGAAALEAALSAAMPLSEFFFNQLAKDIDLGSADGKARLAERAKVLIQRIPDGEFRDAMQSLLVQRTEVGFHSSAKLSDQISQLANQLHRDALDVSRGQMPSGYLVSLPKVEGRRNERDFKRAGRKGVTPEPAFTAPRPAGVDHRRSLVRTAISLLLAQPDLAQTDADIRPLEAIELPGADLLAALIKTCRSRPGLSTGSLLSTFSDHPSADALQKLAAEPITGDDAGMRQDFEGCLKKLGTQATQQRLDTLRGRATLTTEEKDELRALLLQKP